MRIYRNSATLGETSIGFFGTSTQATNQAWVIGEGGWGNAGDFTIGNENGGAGGNVRMLIQRDGNVGIGTTSPTMTLSVQGTSSNGINVMGVGTTATRAFMGLNASNNGYLFVTGSSGQSPSLINSAGGDSYISGGNVGIGTSSPRNKLDIALTGAEMVYPIACSCSNRINHFSTC